MYGIIDIKNKTNKWQMTKAHNILWKLKLKSKSKLKWYDIRKNN